MAWRKRITPAKIFSARLKRRGEFWFWNRTTFSRGLPSRAPINDWAWFPRRKKRGTKRESWVGSSSFVNRSPNPASCRPRDSTARTWLPAAIRSEAHGMNSAGVAAILARENETRAGRFARPRFCFQSSALQGAADRLDLGVILEDFVAHLAAPAGLFVSAERHRCVKNVVAIDPHGSGAELGGESMSFLDVAAPDSCGETVLRIVSLCGNFVDVAERNRR